MTTQVKITKALPKYSLRRLEDIRPNPDNPRYITETGYADLLNKIRTQPNFLLLNPLVVDKNNYIRSGNQRYRACLELGIEFAPVLPAEEFTEAELQDFEVIVNKHDGAFDMNLMSNRFDLAKMKYFGIDPFYTTPVLTPSENEKVDLENFSKTADTYLNNTIRQIVLLYSVEDHTQVLEDLDKIGTDNGIKDDTAETVKLLIQFYRENQ